MLLLVRGVGEGWFGRGWSTIKGHCFCNFLVFRRVLGLR